jgi:exodeoxyribonuclease V alpha subunit
MKNKKVKNKVVIVDEASMIDIIFIHITFERTPLKVKLILVGDANQLPSIGPGDVLNNFAIL